MNRYIRKNKKNNLICEEFCYSQETRVNELNGVPSQIFESQNFDYIWRKLNK